jgi:hypothetical protein
MQKIFGVLGLFVGFSLFVACEKEENNLGDNLITDTELDHFVTDTSSIITTYRVIDSVWTLNPNFPILGAINDPELGKTEASFYTQLHLSKNEINFGSDLVLDSIVLDLKYTNYYGDTTLNQHFIIQEVTEVMDTVKKYSNQDYETGDVLADLNFIPKVQNKVGTGDDADIEFLSQRFRLNDAFGQKILDKSGQEELQNDGNFLEFFKGLYIDPQNEFATDEGTFLTVDYTNSKVWLFYTNSIGSDSLDFRFNSDSKRLNHFEHHYEGTPVQSSFETDTNTAAIYIQSLAGMDIQFDFPNLTELEGAYINKAVLVLPRDVDPAPVFETYTRLRAEHYDAEEGTYEPILDENSYGGTYSEDKHEFSFTITRLIQEIVDGKTDKKLFIRSESNFSGARAKINGVNHPDDGIKLHLTYSKEK